MSGHTRLKRLAGATALQSAHSDMQRATGHASTAVGNMLLVATLLRQTAVREDQRSRRIALRLARETLGANALRRGCTNDHRPAESELDVIRLLAHHAQQAGFLATAQNLLESASHLCETPLDRGRLLTERARNSRKLGLLDLCQAQNAAVLALANEIDSDELRVRATFDLAALAQTRGNFVAMKRFLQRGIRVAEQGGFGPLAATGYIGLGIHAAKRGQFDEAVSYLWTAYGRSDGRSEAAQEVLVNLGQVFLDAGHPAEAQIVSSLARQAATSVHLTLPALGCLAVASARIGDRKTTNKACAAIRKLDKPGLYPRELAGALLDCSAAMAALGATAQAVALHERAMTLAGEYGFHDLTFVPPAAQAHVFAAPATRIVQSLADLESRGPTNRRLQLA